jgi:hypothetical protein
MLEVDSFEGASYLIAEGLVLGAAQEVLVLCSPCGFPHVDWGSQLRGWLWAQWQCMLERHLETVRWNGTMALPTLELSPCYFWECPVQRPVSGCACQI